MVINLPNFSLQKPVCRLLTVIGFLGFSGTIASQSTMSENIDSVGTSIKKKFSFNEGSRWAVNRSIGSAGGMIPLISRSFNALNFYLFSNY